MNSELMHIEQRLSAVNQKVAAALNQSFQKEQALSAVLDMSFQAFQQQCQALRAKGEPLTPEAQSLVKRLLAEPSTTTSRPLSRKHHQFI